MKVQRDTLESQKTDYEEKLRGLKAYAHELKATADKHSTDSEHYADDLTRATHDAEFYEAELSRVCAELADANDDLTYHVFKDDAGEWRWHLRAHNQRIIADSGEGYRDREDCLHGIALVKSSSDAPVEDKP